MADDDLPDALRQAILTRGLCVFPTRATKAKGKPRKPYVKWADTRDSFDVAGPFVHLRNTAQLHRRYPDAVWAAVTGEDFGGVVLDFDGPEGLATFNRLGLKATTTTPTGSPHVWVDGAPGGIGLVTAPADGAFAGMEVKGNGGSVTFYGTRPGVGDYQHDPARSVRWDQLPEDLRAYLAGCAVQGRERPAGSGTGAGGSSAVWAHKLGEAIAAAVAGDGRNQRGHWLAQQLHWNDASVDDVRQLMERYRSAVTDLRSDPYTTDEVNDTVAGVLAGPKRDPEATGDTNGPFAADGSSWEPVDLGPVLAGEVAETLPELGRRDDGVPLIYVGKLHSINGEPESGKSWFALMLCAQVMGDGHSVVYIDFEDSAASVVGRLRVLGVADEVIGTQFVYLRPDEPVTGFERQVADLVSHTAAVLVVVDGVTEAMSTHGLSVKDNDDVARFMRKLPKVIRTPGQRWR